MLVWVLHRICGMGMALFVGMHILASFSSELFGLDFAKSLNAIYISPSFQILVSSACCSMPSMACGSPSSTCGRN